MALVALVCAWAWASAGAGAGALGETEAGAGAEAAALALALRDRLSAGCVLLLSPATDGGAREAWRVAGALRRLWRGGAWAWAGAPPPAPDHAHREDDGDEGVGGLRCGGGAGRRALVVLMGVGPHLAPLLRQVSPWLSEALWLLVEDAAGGAEAALAGVEVPLDCQKEPFLTVKKTPKNGQVLEGIIGLTWSALEKQMNFSTRVVAEGAAGEAWGVRLANGSWSGLLSRLLDGGADAALGAVTMSRRRQAAFDFTQPILRGRMCVFVRVDGPAAHKGLRWQHFLAPFAQNLWAAVAAAAGAFALAHWAAAHPPPPLRLLVRALFDALGALCLQGWEAAAGAGAGAERGRGARRLVEGVASLLAVTLYSAFAANLIAALAVRRQHLPFHSFEGLLRHPRFQLGVAARSSAFSYFQRSPDTTARAVFERLVAPAAAAGELPASEWAALQAACARTHYAALVSMHVGLLFARRHANACTLAAVPQAALPQALGLALPPRSPLRSLLDYNLRELLRSGVLERLRAQAMAMDPDAAEAFERAAAARPGAGAAAGEVQGVSLADVAPLLLMAGAGAAAGGAALLGERLLARFRPRARPRPPQPFLWLNALAPLYSPSLRAAALPRAWRAAAFGREARRRADAVFRRP